MDGATRYDVYRDGRFSKNAGTANFVTDAGLAPNTSYKFKITATLRSGQRYSNEITVRTSGSNSRPPASTSTQTSAPSSTPTNNSTFTLSRAHATHNQIGLTWNQVPGATRYDVYRDGQFVRNANLSRLVSDSNLRPNTSYRYKITATTPSGPIYSNEITVRTNNAP